MSQRENDIRNARDFYEHRALVLKRIQEDLKKQKEQTNDLRRNRVPKNA